ncbi:hypothetical protein ABS772_23730 [Methylorubrum podarium]|uniref:Uncharacterized protein n=1 Tax=Methylorubrum podarium TaxID=200476 RepID=A0ABV1QU36_9HYPH
MTNTNNPALASLARRLVMAELAARGARNPENVESIVAPRLRLDGSGDLVAVDHGGSVLPGKLLSDVLDDVQRSHPSLFRSPLPAGKSQGKEQSNPFAPGPGHSITEQMILWRSDPERAEYLASEAGLRIKPLR